MAPHGSVIQRWLLPMLDYLETAPLHTFTSYKRAGYIPLFVGLVSMIVIELTVVHVVIWLLGYNLIAWVLTGMSLYSLFWLAGDYRAVLNRPVELTERELIIHVGRRWSVAIPQNQIKGVRPWPTGQEPGNRKAFLNAALFGRPHYEVRLNGPVIAKGIYGIRKEINTVGVCIDDPNRFEAVLKRLGLWEG